MVEARGVWKRMRNGSGSVEILKGIDLLVPRGQFVTIMGASGSGKSTLLGLLAGLDSPSEGQVLVDGVDISNMPEDTLAGVRGAKIGFVFQSYQLIPTLTAFENVLLPFELNRHEDGKTQARALLADVVQAIACTTTPCSSRGASSRGSRWRVRLCWSRRS
jgi:putative ABC transport system ATP-binding protein